MNANTMNFHGPIGVIQTEKRAVANVTLRTEPLADQQLVDELKQFLKGALPGIQELIQRGYSVDIELDNAAPRQPFPATVAVIATKELR